MITNDQFNNKIEMQFTNPDDQANGEHVLAIPLYQGKYILTNHKKRGIEFPGGKIEKNETSENAIKRELFEETGAIVQDMQYIAQYTVNHPNGKRWFTKDVFAVNVKKIESKQDYLETNGPVIVHTLDAIDEHEKSYLLTDEVILKCAERVNQLGLYQ